jgi:hypothetical protein
MQNYTKGRKGINISSAFNCLVKNNSDAYGYAGKSISKANPFLVIND